MKRHVYNKVSNTKGELRSTTKEVPEDDLQVEPVKKQVLVNGLHPRCGIDREDAEAREEIEDAEQ